LPGCPCWWPSRRVGRSLIDKHPSGPRLESESEWVAQSECLPRSALVDLNQGLPPPGEHQHAEEIGHVDALDSSTGVSGGRADLVGDSPDPFHASGIRDADIVSGDRQLADEPTIRSYGHGKSLVT